MAKTRWEQLHRYVHIRDKYTCPQRPDEGFWWKIELLGTWIRFACQANWSPATHISIDESMIPFCGASEDTVKMPNKPIHEGFKVWVLGDAGYVWTWLWYSGHKKKGTEIIGKKRWNYKLDTQGNTTEFAPTFAIILFLAQLLLTTFHSICWKSHPRPTNQVLMVKVGHVINMPRHRYILPAPLVLDRIHTLLHTGDPPGAMFSRCALCLSNIIFVLILDNLFLNLEVAQALLQLSIACCGTTRKNAVGIPSELLLIKEKNRLYLWDSCIAMIRKRVLCFFWQDNNPVLSLTTAYSLHKEGDIIIRNRKRPKLTSTNASITRKVFGDNYVLELAILRVIDDYNHHMNGVDVANQFRAWMTTYRPGIYKAWQPLWYYLLDICACNAFLVWQNSHPDLNRAGKRLHRQFQNELIDALFTIPDKRPTTVRIPVQGCLVPGHERRRMPTRRTCAWCLKERKEIKPRQFGDVLVNGVGPKVLPRSESGCGRCKVNLCKEGSCWRHWHTQYRPE